MTESQLQASIIDLARRCNWLAFHVIDSRKSTGPGFPDLVLVHKGTGRLILAELKSPTGRLRPDQATWLAALGIRNETAVWRPEHWRSGEIQALLLGERRVAA